MNFIRNLLKLYRLDVFVITMITSVCGYYLTKKSVDLQTLIDVLFVSGILYNYVYILNAITDVEADKINKPERPLPSGKISKNSAIIYLAFIGLLSLTGAIFLFNGFNRTMVILVIIIGGIYSVPPFELKKIPILAPFITGWGIVHPIFITGDFDIVLIPAIVLTLYAIGTTLLKDLSDIEGDIKEGRIIVSNMISIKKLLIISMVMTFFASLFSLKLEYKIIGLAPLSTFFTTLYYFIFKEINEIKKFIYKRMILSVAIVGSIVMLVIITGLA